MYITSDVRSDPERHVVVRVAIVRQRSWMDLMST
jgi:hypothetical protein